MSKAKKRRALYGLIVVALILLLTSGLYTMIAMPGHSYQGNPPLLSAMQQKSKRELQQIVETLARKFGFRDVKHHTNLLAALEFAQAWFQKLGYKIWKQTYRVDGKEIYNIEATHPSSTSKNILVLGAHIDSVYGSPGANDNASGVAILMMLAKRLQKRRFGVTLRFVVFVNEEPPYFRSSQMGSMFYARHCKNRKDRIIGMISLETLGYYTSKRHSQRYPFPLHFFYPTKGNFVAWVGDTSSRHFLKRCIKGFRKYAKFPSEGFAGLRLLPGVGWSDHWAFWRVGYPGVMLTDTAPYRYPHYHSAKDTPDKLDYTAMAHITTGLRDMLVAEYGTH